MWQFWIQSKKKQAANEACEAMAKHDQIAWLTDKLLKQENFELPGGDLWKILAVRFMEDLGSPIHGRSWQSVQEWITIIKFWYNQWICKDYSRGNIQWWSNLTNLRIWLTKLSNLVICRFAYWRDVFSQRQATIKSNTKVWCRCWGWDYVTTNTIEEDWILFRCWGLPIMRNSVFDGLTN